ncbi:aspartate-semialdehyde dehydrogenase [Agrilactobacillus fermenti]|uniref:aspartate-semialdehyde dehydrogenase n=1 Tax=Agrilactobacillus fermenti TaxID=2586909 RepID=UPI001E3CAE61|nr:aspartate-semialdehyde dehydrogenase [Agrilactobacillus fermenti]MCD2255254.1 aspartate-semialdehyde dehydrogenase [Agrilactobacillus fermenti]
MSGYNVAIVGATGAVGSRFIQLLEYETKLPINSVKLLASKRSAGKQLKFKDQMLTVEETTPDSFEGVDLALFSAGGSVSAKFAPEAVKHGAVVVDNTSHFRMDPEVPLVVPEVNPQALKRHHGIIANPNCSTIQMVVALEPVRQKFGLDQVICSTYQAVSGAGQSAINELMTEAQQVLNHEPVEPKILPVSGDEKHYQIAFNTLAQIDVFEDEDYTHEEWKMINETRKIMEDNDLKVTATCVRVPIVVSHSETVYFTTTDRSATPDDIRAVLKTAPGVVVEDDPKHQVYPQPINAEGKKDTFVGRIRRDMDNQGSFHMYVVSDNLLKGAAWNSLEIAETLHEMNLLHVQD